MMSFDQSTQCKSWLFSEKDLKLCREKAAGEQFVARKQNGEARVRKYASGFKPTAIESVHSPRSVQLVDDFIPPPTSLSSDEQEILVRFHAHQISMLVGPDAILPSLIRSETVFSTSIMIFRRFYLSNSVLDFSPRTMAVASCFLASKLEENRIEIGSLSKATRLIYDKIKNAPMCRRELGFVSVAEIQAAERDLMEGLNYEMRFHHPHCAISVLCSNASAFIDDLAYEEETKWSGKSFDHAKSPRATLETQRHTNAADLLANAILIASNALIFSDAPFLFPPGQIAFAAVAMAMKVSDPYAAFEGLIHPILCAFLRNRFESKEEEDIRDFEDEVSRIIQTLMDSPVMDLKLLALSRPSAERDVVVAEQAERLRQVFRKVNIIRDIPAQLTSDPIGSFRKRKHNAVLEFTLSPPSHPMCTHKVARITPTKL